MDVEQFPKSADILCVVVNKHELWVAERFIRCTVSTEDEEGFFYQYGKATCSDGSEVRVILTQSHPGSVGARRAQDATTRALHAFQVSLVVSVGVAYGYDASKQNIGDVLVSEAILPYELTREGEGEVTVNRNDAIVLERFPFVKRAKRSALKWSLPTVNPAFKNLEAHSGSLLCGEKLFAKAEKKHMAAALHHASVQPGKLPSTSGRSIIGGEMEAVGIAAPSAERYKSTQFIVIKGIADYGDEEKAAGEAKVQVQRIAAFSAWRFFLNVSAGFKFTFLDIRSATPSSAGVLELNPSESEHEALIKSCQEYAREAAELERVEAEPSAERDEYERLKEVHKQAKAAASKAKQAMDDASMALAETEVKGRLRDICERMMDNWIEPFKRVKVGNLPMEFELNRRFKPQARRWIHVEDRLPTRFKMEFYDEQVQIKAHKRTARKRKSKQAPTAAPESKPKQAKSEPEDVVMGGQ